MSSGGEKAEDAFRTIGELSAELGIQQHILRYWETRFPQLRPLQRAGNRRYYRPSDVALVRYIHSLLNEQGYTIRGVQKLLAQKGAPAGDARPAAEEPATVEPVAVEPASSEPVLAPAPVAPEPIASQPLLVVPQNGLPADARSELAAIRDSLARALAADMD